MKEILKEELNQIKYLFDYKKGVVISEQSTPAITSETADNKTKSNETKNYSITDIQNKIKEIGYGDMLGKYGSDGKFGKMTYSAVTSSLSDFKRRQDKSANLAGATTIASKPLPSLEVLRKEIKINPPKSWCEQNTIQDPPYNERCFSMKGEDENDAAKKLRAALEADFKEYKNKRSSFWDNAEKFLYQVWGGTVEKKDLENRQNVIDSIAKGTYGGKNQQSTTTNADTTTNTDTTLDNVA